MNETIQLDARPSALSLTCQLQEDSRKDEVYRVQLQNKEIRITLTNIGCAITGIYTPDRQGVSRNIVAGYKDLAQYFRNPHYLGCVVGRYANRIDGGRFLVDGVPVQLTCNDGTNHLHGGVEGFHKKIWKLTTLIQEREEVGVELEYFSADGEEGYPGNLTVRVRYLLNHRNQLSMQYTAVTDRKTPVNLTNHSYFNLSGFEQPTILDHRLCLNAGQYTPKNVRNLPMGHFEPVDGRPQDFRTEKRIGEDIDQLGSDGGYDQNYVLTRSPSGLRWAARLSDPQSGRTLCVSTDQPGMQVYTANLWDGFNGGEHEGPYIRHGAVALETQAFPDSPNQAAFPDTILHPGQTFRSATVLEFGVGER